MRCLRERRWMTSVIEAWGRHRLASRSMKSTEKDKAKTRRQQAGKKAFQEGILPGGPREQRLALLSFESKARGGVEGRARARSTIDKPPNGPTFIAPWSPC
jgi:hypothetical protein